MNATTIKLTKGTLSKEEATKLSPKYVSFVESHSSTLDIIEPFMWDWNNVKPAPIRQPACKLKKGQKLLTFVHGQYVTVKISSIRNPMHDADGPIVRVSNGEYSWRVDGDKYGVLI